MSRVRSFGCIDRILNVVLAQDPEGERANIEAHLRRELDGILPGPRGGRYALFGEVCIDSAEGNEWHRDETWFRGRRFGKYVRRAAR